MDHFRILRELIDDDDVVTAAIREQVAAGDLAGAGGPVGVRMWFSRRRTALDACSTSAYKAFDGCGDARIPDRVASALAALFYP